MESCWVVGPEQEVGRGDGIAEGWSRRVAPCKRGCFEIVCRVSSVVLRAARVHGPGSKRRGREKPDLVVDIQTPRLPAGLLEQLECLPSALGPFLASFRERIASLIFVFGHHGRTVIDSSDPVQRLRPAFGVSFRQNILATLF